MRTSAGWFPWLKLVLIVPCLGILVAPSLDANATGPDEELVSRILKAKSLTTLESAIPKAALQDPALRVLYSIRRLELHKTVEEERAFLAALPKSENELERVYALSYLEQYRGHENSTLGDAAYEIFELAARSAHKLKTGHQRVFELCLWSNADSGEIAWEWCDWLHVQDPSRAYTAIKALPLEEQKRICGAPIESFTVKEAVRKCRSEMSVPLE
jgi:hypothetical protein